MMCQMYSYGKCITHIHRMHGDSLQKNTEHEHGDHDELTDDADGTHDVQLKKFAATDPQTKSEAEARHRKQYSLPLECRRDEDHDIANETVERRRDTERM